MNDKEFLEQKIAQVKASNEQLESQLANMESTSDNLADLLAELRNESDKASSMAARLVAMSEDQEERRREIAKLRGIKYCDPDDPDYEYPEHNDDV